MSNSFIKIRKAIGVLLFGGLFVSIFNFLTSSYITKYYGVHFFGNYVFIVSFFVFISAIFNAQTWQPLVKDLKNENKSEKSTFITYYILETLFSLFGVVVALIIQSYFFEIFNFKDKDIPLYLYLVIIVMQNNTFYGYFRYNDKHHLINFFQMIQVATLLILTIFIFIFYKDNLDYLLMAFVFSYLLSYILCFIYILSRLTGCVSFDNKFLYQAIKNCFPFYITTLTDSPIRDFTIFIINKVSGVELVGFYRLLTQFGGVFSKLSLPIYQASFSEFVDLINKNMLDELFLIIKKIMCYSVVVLLSLSIFLYFSYELWVGYFFSSSYIEYKGYFLLYLIIQIIIGTFMAINSTFLAKANGRDMFVMTLIINVIFIIVIYILSVKFAFIGVLISILIQVLLNAVLKTLYIKSKLL